MYVLKLEYTTKLPYLKTQNQTVGTLLILNYYYLNN